MDYTSKLEGTFNEVSMSGDFLFSDNVAVKKMITEILDSEVTSCSINLDGLDSIDSAGLGMLILINDAVQQENIKLELCGASGQVKKMLEISKFSEIINIKP